MCYNMHKICHIQGLIATENRVNYLEIIWGVSGCNPCFNTPNRPNTTFH